MMKRIFTLLVSLIIASGNWVFSQNNFTVTKTTDPDPFTYPYSYVDSLCDPVMYGTFQWAIRKANDAPDSSLISFDIQGAGSHTITLNHLLPVLSKPITIDGTTQAGYDYANGPSIIIDGTNIPYNTHCFNTSGGSESYVFKGLLIKNFHLTNGITIWGPNAKIIDNIFQDVGGYDSGLAPYRAMGIYVAAPKCVIQGNIFGTDIADTANYGTNGENIYMQNQWLPADSCLIGGDGVNEGNYIANSSLSGVTIINGKHNKISRNRFKDNGIQLVIYAGSNWWGNEGKSAPTIDTITPAGVLSGKAESGDIIEIFSSTGSNNANEYVCTTTADTAGYWSTVITNYNRNYLIATATDSVNNTSELSSAFEIVMSCTADAGSDDTICAGQNAQLQTNVSFAYAWSSSPADTTLTGQANLRNPVVSPAVTTTYTVTVSNAMGCTQTDEVVINLYNKLTAGGIGSYQTICYNTNPLTFTSIAPASGGKGTITYQWQIDEGCSNSWTNIIGANSEDYSHVSNLMQNTCFRRIVSDTCGTVYSNIDTNGLLGHWPFDENLDDVFGGNNASGGIGTIWAFDRHNDSSQAIYFDGNDYYQLDYGIGNFTPYDDFTFSLWVNFEEINIGGLLQRGHTVGGYGFFRNNTQILFGSRTLSGTSRYISFTPQLSQWYMLTGVHNGTNGLMSLYVNGNFIGNANIQQGMGNYVTGSILTNTFHRIEGPGSQSSPFKGAVDDVQIFSKVLTPDEIEALYFDTEVKVNINPLPTANAGPDTLIFAGDSVQIGTDSISGYTYAWSPGTGLSDSTVARPWGKPMQNTTYYLMVTDTNNCQNADNVSISLLGETCENAIQLNVDSIVWLSQTFFMTDTTMWFTFIADSSFIRISIENSQDSLITHNIDSIKLYKGLCDSLLLVQQQNFFNVLFINTTELEVGYAYYIKVFSSFSDGSFKIKINYSKGASFWWGPDNSGCFPCWSTFCQNDDLFFYNYSYGINEGCCYFYYIDNNNPGNYYEAENSPQNWDFTTFNSSLLNIPAGWYDVVYYYSSDCTPPTNTQILNASLISMDHLGFYLNQSPSLSIISNPYGTPNAYGNIDICSNSSVQMNLNAIGGGVYGSYQWSTGAMTPTILVSQSISSVVTYTVTYTYGCSSTESVVVSVFSQPYVNILGGPTILCIGESSSIYANVTYGTPPFNYLWNTGEQTQFITLIANNIGVGNYLYSVQITDANGCTASSSTGVSINSLPYADAGADDKICVGAFNNVQLNASGGTSYVWAPTTDLSNPNNIANPTASPTVTTTYTVTVTDDNGCSASDDVVINVHQQPYAGFTVTNLCQTNVTFQSNPYDQNLTYEWDFENDGNFVSFINNPQSVVHNYPAPGNYLVTQKVTDANMCSSFYSQLIQVIPSVDGYNANCCSNNDVTYTQDGDFTASTNATWTDGNNPFGNASSPVIVRGTVRIPAGIEITIEDMTFQFDPNSRVIVEREGMLRLDNTIFRGIEYCHTMWQGIEVWGDATYRHYLPIVSVPPSPPVADVTGQSKQGKLIMLNEATIQDAHTAVLLGRSLICIPNIHEPNQLCKRLPYLLSYDGGIIEADSAIFKRNAIGVKFLPFKPATGTGYVNYNASKITNCTFESFGTLFDPGYSTNNTYQYPNTNTFNPTFANANATQHAITGIYMWGVRNVTLIGNTFGSDSPYLIEGIKSYDSPYNVSTSLFQNLDYGIRIFNSNSTIMGNQIINNKYTDGNGFKNIYENPIQIESSKFSVIKENSFNDPGFTSSWSTSGILLKNSMNFRVQDNDFYKINKGIEVINSSPGFSRRITGGFGGGSIASLNRAQGNDFVECPLDIETKGYNQRLQLHCNTSTNDDIDYYNGSNWENYGFFNHQGQLDFSTEARLPAGNAFNPSDNDPRKIINNNFEIFQIPYPNTLPVYYTYYRHGGTSAPERIPSSQSLQYNINAASSAYNAQTSCLPCSTYTGSYRSVLQDMEVEYDSLVAVYDTVFSNLDSNATQLLLDSINGSMNDDSLLVLLLAHSPLSDTVIAAALNRPLSTNNIDDLLIPNSPLSDVGRYYLNIIIDTLPSEIKGRILEVQAHNPSYTTLTSLDRDLLVLENSYQLQLNSFIEYLLDNDSLAEAITILDSLGNNDAKRLVLSTYLADSNYTEVASRLENFEPLTEEEEDWKDLFSLLYEMAIDSLTIFEMDSTQEAFVRELAEDNTCSPASVNAQAILRLLYEEEFPECPTAFQERKASVSWPTNKHKTESGHLGQNIPNPFSNTTLIPYYLPENTAHAAICVYDITGKKIHETALQNNKGTISLTLDNFQAGIYLYSLIIDNKPIQTKRMVLIK